MTSVGDTLRRERVKRNLDLDQISRELKISRRLLDAIESDQYDRLPGGVFAKAFVRQYAHLLGLEEEELAAQVQHALEPPALQFAEKSRPAAGPIGILKVEEWRSVGDGRSRFSGSLPAAALVVVVMLICSAVYAWMERPRTAKTAKSTPPAPVYTQPAAPRIVREEPPAVAAEAQPLPAPGPAAAAAASTPQTTPAAPAGPVHVEIVADEPVWILARADGKVTFSGTVEANARRAVDAEKDVVLRLGNAGGVTILLNGKPIGPAGPKGQVRTLQFTSGGFQIVSAKPEASAPFDPLDRL